MRFTLRAAPTGSDRERGRTRKGRAMAKKKRFDTSFNFGANVKTKGGGGKKGRRKKPKGAKIKTRSYFSTTHGS
jgi:hypothetical protein